MKHLTRFAATAALCLAALPATAQQKTLKVSLYIPLVHPLGPSLEAWGTSLNEASEGTIDVQLYPSEQLGKTVDQYDMARDGITEMAMAPPGLQPGRFPIVTLGELPFLAENGSTDSASFHRWYANYAALEMPDVKLCMLMFHYPGTLHTNGVEVKVPADLAGLKIRPGNGTLARYLTDQGASTVQAALPELRELTERGVVDGISFPWNSLFITKAEANLTYHLDLKLYTAMNAFVMNQSFYDGLNDVQKAAVDSHCTPEWSEALATPWAEFEEAGKPKIAALEGHVVYTPTDAELDQWKAAATPLRDVAFEGLSRYPDLDGATLMEELEAELAAGRK